MRAAVRGPGVLREGRLSVLRAVFQHYHQERAVRLALLSFFVDCTEQPGHFLDLVMYLQV